MDGGKSVDEASFSSSAITISAQFTEDGFRRSWDDMSRFLLGRDVCVVT